MVPWPAGQAGEAVPLPPRAAVLESPTRFLIVDDAASTRRLLRAVLEHCPQFEVAGEAENGAVAVERAAMLQPDVVLLDLSMPLADGASVLGSLLRAAPSTRVIILSSSGASRAAPLLEAGATAFLPKGLYPFELLERLGNILGRRVILKSEVIPDESADEPTDTPTDQLTDDWNDPPVAVAPPAPPQVRPRAVVCDDDPMTRRLVAELLAKCDIDVIAETNVVPGLLSVVEIAKPELVVLDLWLEGVTGASALPQLRGISPRSLVVVYSAYAEWNAKALAAGAAAFVAKPNFYLLGKAIQGLAPRLAPDEMAIA
ncbi:MAG: two-component response regulator [Solirubrobacterales bacterium]|jgi:DNA-binding NarL/FixJ family response regulator|nr:two-component response regulator [Solirubrobacterales bacterium]